MLAFITPQKPWLWSDLTSHWEEGYNAADGIPVTPKKLDERDLFLIVTLVVSNIFLAQEIGLLKDNDKTHKFMSGATIGLIGWKSMIKPRAAVPRSKVQSVPIWNYIPRMLAIVNAILIIIGTKQKPVRTFIYAVTVVVDVLDQYKKLPEKVSIAWSYMPLVDTACHLYDGNRTWAALDVSMRVYRYCRYYKGT